MRFQGSNTVPDRQSWTWEVHDTPTLSHPHSDPYNRRPSAHNWIDTGIPGSYDPSSTNHKDLYAPNTYSSHPQEVYGYTPSYGQPQHHPQHHYQHLQHSQQALSNPWYPESQFQQDYNAGFNTNFHDHILEPLSNLLSKPSPLSIIDSSPYQQSIIERLTGVDTSSTSSFVFPGGALVLGLALALFYFNFVWYPTPVVTAKIYKMLSQSVSGGELTEGQERTVGEVYRVFRGLEAEYKHDPSIWSASCRTRVVCQVHQELPGLWKVTQSLRSPRQGDIDLSGYQEAARRGSEGEDCEEHYHECPLNTVPLKATLRRLLVLLQPV
ncbi:hypothetical protein O3P69_000017 [Scylla paramamosain]|uniref:Uncharacterized protein n=1 Tax=Scylla paramamosain TaxID=85552 RepID=A0AAW0UUR5_SCYPA